MTFDYYDADGVYDDGYINIAIPKLFPSICSAAYVCETVFSLSNGYAVPLKSDVWLYDCMYTRQHICMHVCMHV